MLSNCLLVDSFHRISTWASLCRRSHAKLWTSNLFSTPGQAELQELILELDPARGRKEVGSPQFDVGAPAKRRPGGALIQRIHQKADPQRFAKVEKSTYIVIKTYIKLVIKIVMKKYIKIIN